MEAGNAVVPRTFEWRSPKRIGPAFMMVRIFGFPIRYITVSATSPLNGPEFIKGLSEQVALDSAQRPSIEESANGIQKVNYQFSDELGLTWRKDGTVTLTTSVFDQRQFRRVMGAIVDPALVPAFDEAISFIQDTAPKRAPIFSDVSGLSL